MKKQLKNTEDRLKPLNIQGLELKDVLKGVLKVRPSREKEELKGKKSNKK
tara:strand:+ start:309 stop:458 length:150 start_codon:yes stop_codon:yes gene_type:complete